MKPQRTRIGAYGLLIEEGRLLLARLAPHTDEPGVWTLTGGGIDFGEDPRDACRREMREESGLEVEVKEPLHVGGHLWINPQDECHSIQILYRVERTGGELTYELEGSTDLVAWFTKEEILDLPRVQLVDLALEVLGEF